MEVRYSTQKDFSAEELELLFLSVGWESGQYPEKLKRAMENSSTVISAWNGGELVGLMNAMADGVMNVYFQYLLVKPEYQGYGIGRRMVSMMLTEYETYMRKTLIAYDHALDFYKRCGFSANEEATPMTVSSF